MCAIVTTGELREAYEAAVKEHETHTKHVLSLQNEHAEELSQRQVLRQQDQDVFDSQQQQHRAELAQKGREKIELERELAELAREVKLAQAGEEGVKRELDTTRGLLHSSERDQAELNRVKRELERELGNKTAALERERRRAERELQEAAAQAERERSSLDRELEHKAAELQQEQRELARLREKVTRLETARAQVAQDMDRERQQRREEAVETGNKSKEMELRLDVLLKEDTLKTQMLRELFDACEGTQLFPTNPDNPDNALSGAGFARAVGSESRGRGIGVQSHRLDTKEWKTRKAWLLKK